MSKFNIITFAVGAVVGSVAAWLCIKKHYESIAQEEIDSVKAVFSGHKSELIPESKAENCEDKQHKADIANLKPDIIDYAAKLQKEGYINYGTVSAKKSSDLYATDTAPRVITPEEFGEIEEYAQINLTYYSDGVLADDMDEVMFDTENTVGADFANHFGDYENDCVHIRNDRLKCDYEILKDGRSYDEIAGAKFWQED